MGWPRRHDRPRRARQARGRGKPARERVGQQSSLLLASHQACEEDEWFLPHGRGGVERGGGLVPPHGPMGKLSINLVVLIFHANNMKIKFLVSGSPPPRTWHREWNVARGAVAER